jgi:glycosyltransferase involved in cell wall biosynthesis
MKIAIVINTYKKSDNSTKFLLNRALESVKSQTYSDYMVFLIGDNYEDNIEFENIGNDKDLKNKIFYKNLPYSIERERYGLGSTQLWCSGGLTARNYGINVAKSYGYDYICHLDHDDYWHPQHLELINHAIETTFNPAFVYTCGTYYNNYLPNVTLNNEIIEMLPIPCKTIHSSVCINHSQIPLLYRDVYKEKGVCEPADADMWSRISNYIQKNNLKSYLITSLTCFHPTEQN